MDDPVHHISRDGQTLGTFTLEQLRLALLDGRVLPTDYHWAKGMAGWAPVADLTPAIERLTKELRAKAEAAAAAQLAAIQAQQQPKPEPKPQPRPVPAPAPRAPAQPVARPQAPAAGPGQPVDVPVALGSGLIAVGAFCPQISLRLLEGISLNAVGNGTGELAVAAGLAGYTFLHALEGRRQRVAWAAWAGVAILALPVLKAAYRLIEAASHLSELRGGSRGSSFSYDPFSGPHLGIIELIPLPLTFQVGFGLVLLGTLILFRARQEA